MLTRLETEKMAELTNSYKLPIFDLMNNIALNRFNPSNIQRLILDHLETVSNGEVDIVDPTNPFVYLLEASSVNTAVAMAENRLALRRQYPSLAQTEEEVYLHMSDKDFIGRFATPTKTTFTIMIQLNSLLSHMVRDDNEKCLKVTIPRNTEFQIEGWVFSIEYPINIRKYDNGVVQVSYDTSVISPLKTLNTNIIDYTVRRDGDNIDWLNFNTDATQFVIDTTHFPVQSSVAFSETIDFSNNYYYCRVFYKKNSTNGKWVEMLTTHTDQVYDNFKPTAVLKVTDNQITVFIPTIYVDSALVDGNVRIDVYTTHGELTVNLSNYSLTAFTTTLKAIDEEADVNAYTNAMSDIIHIAYSDKVVSGGTAKLTFNELRERVINNAIGSHQLPITNVQLTTSVEKNGFDIVSNLDNITNRIFVATKNLPKPLNTRLLTAATITVDTVISSLEQFKLTDGVLDNGLRTTLTSKLVYLYNNGKIAIYPKAQVQVLKNVPTTTLAETISKLNFLYSPFYYVMDNTGDEFELRPYHLDRPSINGLSFIAQNPTLQLPVNTASFQIEKTDSGYKIVVVTKSGNFYKQLDDVYVQVQLAFIPMGENRFAYINGTLLGKTNDKERIYQFNLETNHDIDTEHNIYFTNFKMFSNENALTPTSLDSQFSIFYTTTSIPLDFTNSPTDSYLGKFMLPSNAAAITHEVLDVTLGQSLKNLWSRSRSTTAGLDYMTYDEDQPMLYEQDVYDQDPVTGSIFTIKADGSIEYLLLHTKGDVVNDVDGVPVFKHRKGDVMLDEYDKPLLLNDKQILRHCDILFVDGIYYFSTDQTYINYKEELSDIISTWVTSDLGEIDNMLLEQTKIFYYPKRSIGLVKVMLSNNNITSIESQQSFEVELYVRSTVFRDSRIREELTRNTIEYINKLVQTRTISISDIVAQLKLIYDQSVVSVKLSGLGGVNNYETVTLLNDNEQLCLRKKLVAQEDGSLIVAEDIKVSFINYEV